MLRDIISYIPAGTLRKLVGQSISDAIVNFNTYNNNIEINYADNLIYNKYGADLVNNKKFLNAYNIHLLNFI